MSRWVLAYDGYDPATEGLREALCTLGNGYVATRGAAPESPPTASTTPEPTSPAATTGSRPRSAGCTPTTPTSSTCRTGCR
ncbi:hypothetical protein ACFQY7_03245 [Actinomadura luteofluorescens]|uniref:hypothetical protein n=1 Tax=Actinomadura luteofluorescens TaxID=46163 RepID=UPI003625DE45